MWGAQCCTSAVQRVQCALLGGRTGRTEGGLRVGQVWWSQATQVWALCVLYASYRMRVLSNGAASSFGCVCAAAALPAMRSLLTPHVCTHVPFHSCGRLRRNTPTATPASQGRGKLLRRFAVWTASRDRRSNHRLRPARLNWRCICVGSGQHGAWCYRHIGGCIAYQQHDYLHCRPKQQKLCSALIDGNDEPRC